MRMLKGSKFYSVLNITGLAIGITCCILILMYVLDELSYDRYHERADDIYRLSLNFTTTERTFEAAVTSHVMGPMLMQEYPEIESYVRFDTGSRRVVRYGDRSFNEDRFMWADSTLFSVFSFEMVQGDPETALKDPYTVVITEEIAEKYFGSENPIGKNLTVHFDTEYTVTGVIKNIPDNTHFTADFFGSFSTLNFRSLSNIAEELLSNIDYPTYLLLRENTDYKEFEGKLADFVEKYVGPVLDSLGAAMVVHVDPVTSIHLHSDYDGELGTNSDIMYVYLFSGIGFFILLIACLNFINLATARSANRAREVGLRKVVGAMRLQLIGQFIGESVILAVFALGIALVLVYMILPVFNTISGKELTFAYLFDPVLILYIAGVFIFVGIIGGSYPAFFLSAFRPVDVLKGTLTRGTKGSVLRVILVSLQFTVSIVLMIGTFVVYEQLNFMQNKRLGFDKEHVLVFRMRNDATQQKYEMIKDELRRHPEIINVSASSHLPTGSTSMNAHHLADRPEDDIHVLAMKIVDEDFIPTYNFEMAEGRNFSKEYATDAEDAVLINETAVREFGWQDDPLGKEIELFTGLNTKVTKKVIGVVKDFHFESLHQKITPLILYKATPFSSYFYISVKMQPRNVMEMVDYLKSKWKEFDSQYPFEYFFLDENYDALYRAEELLGRLFSYFTLLAIVIGCLGLFGLASFSAQQRTKEIGIRKTLGATVSNIILLLLREFTKWVVAANVIAWPAAYFFMREWMENFAFRADVGIDIFLFSAFIALVIAALTVTYHAIKAARANPVKSLRYE